MADLKTGNAMTTIYHVVDGPRKMYHIDARHALQFRDQWRTQPDFTEEEADAYLRKEIEDAEQTAEITGDPQDKRRAVEVKRRNERRLKNFTEQPRPRPETAIVIPDNWQNLPALQRINLAAKLGADRKGLIAAKADEVIQAEVDRRQDEIENPPQRNPKPSSEPDGDKKTD
ncbi:hypothetical protein [Bradyrhizobium sp. 141]|uniref:hypothetical protein n=1 Tax=Bradyrhizobium sp. 141 TaxID=2782617 RepID=UPI001FF8D3C9|nr:hypothetical protein [Bradyrhizobium sp. 141]MCK1718867.1 hypothetical protein [Bradyrhizobium sp. 141]